MGKRSFIFIVLMALILAGCALPLSGGSQATQAPEPAFVTGTPMGTLPPTDTLVPQETPTPTATTTQEVLPTTTETSTPVPPTPVPTPQPRYVIQEGSPVGTVNFIFPDKACNWMGVGGQVFSLEGEPVTGLVVEVGGTLEGKDVSLLALTGGSTPLGPGGFEITLSNQPVDSQMTLWLQLYDLKGAPQSEKIYFDTYASCEQNLVLINFTSLTAQPTFFYRYFPFILKNVPPSTPAP